MAKSAKTNGLDMSVVEDLIKRHERLDADVETVMANARNEAKVIRSDQAEIIVEAKEAHGIPKKVLLGAIRVRRAQKAEAAALAKVDPDVIDEVQMVLDSLGEYASTPLGAAAVSKAA